MSHRVSSRRILRTVVRLVCAPSLFSLLFSPAVMAADFQEPITLKSKSDVLDLLMIAKAGPINSVAAQTPGGVAPTGWVYEICERPVGGVFACPASSGTPNLYGGTLLQLNKGDTLKIHLVNQLPKVTDSDHAGEDGHAFLAQNPTNLHTHGMLVSPNGPSDTDPTYGDNVFVLTFNSANGTPLASPHTHSDIRIDYIDYKIKIPANHPSGLFWFHPHAHGISLNQVSAGLGGIITVGSLSDYVCRDRPCAGLLSSVGTRHVILKDTQVIANGTLQDQEDPTFCAPATGASTPAPLQGFCAGTGSFSGGKWFFTLNGQMNPAISVKSGSGEIWRIANVSGSATYDLNLWNPLQKRRMLMQVISIDGVSVQTSSGMSTSQLMQIGGSKFKPEACPGLSLDTGAAQLEQPICTRILHMMPSSRVEVWVTYRDDHDAITNPPAGAAAIFRTDGFFTGGDQWPAIDLGQVQFAADTRLLPVHALSVNGEAATLMTPTALSRDMAPFNALVKPDPACPALAAGHMRRVFYGVPVNDQDGFGLATEEVDKDGNLVGPPAADLIPFDPSKPTICVPLGPDNAQVKERWQLVNVATEDHNFHIHQVKFRVIGKDELSGSVLPNQGVDKGILMDNVPLPRASGTCGANPPTDISNSISDWRNKLCTATPVTVEVPFTIAGDFVFHCHILEHEDGGMMARIRVRPTQ